MSSPTEKYDERARDLAREARGLLDGVSSPQAVEDAIFLMLKIAYADGVIDQLRGEVE